MRLDLLTPILCNLKGRPHLCKDEKPAPKKRINHAEDFLQNRSIFNDELTNEN